MRKASKATLIIIAITKKRIQSPPTRTKAKSYFQTVKTKESKRKRKSEGPERRMVGTDHIPEKGIQKK